MKALLQRRICGLQYQRWVGCGTAFAMRRGTREGEIGPSVYLHSQLGVRPIRAPNQRTHIARSPRSTRAAIQTSGAPVGPCTTSFGLRAQRPSGRPGGRLLGPASPTLPLPNFTAVLYPRYGHDTRREAYARTAAPVPIALRDLLETARRHPVDPLMDPGPLPFRRQARDPEREAGCLRSMPRMSSATTKRSTVSDTRPAWARGDRAGRGPERRRPRAFAGNGCPRNAVTLACGPCAIGPRLR